MSPANLKVPEDAPDTEVFKMFVSHLNKNNVKVDPSVAGVTASSPDTDYPSSLTTAFYSSSSSSASTEATAPAPTTD